MLIFWRITIQGLRGQVVAMTIVVLWLKGILGRINSGTTF